MAVDRHLVSNLLSLNGLDEFKPFRDYLESQLVQWMGLLMSATDKDAMLRAQGRCQAYADLKELLGKAPALADKMREKS